jgi:predicted N-acetyltransferase YhbS
MPDTLTTIAQLEALYGQPVEAATVQPLTAPFSDDAFMALELAPGVLQGEEGRVTYPPAFGVTDA